MIIGFPGLVFFSFSRPSKDKDSRYRKERIVSEIKSTFQTLILENR